MSDGMMEAYRAQCAENASELYIRGLIEHLRTGATEMLEAGRKAMTAERMTQTLKNYDARIEKMLNGDLLAWARMIEEASGKFIGDERADRALQALSPLKDRVLVTFSQGYGFLTMSADIMQIFAPAIEANGVLAGKGRDDRIRPGGYTLAIEPAALEALKGTLVIRRERDQRTDEEVEQGKA